jgi:hypothetical protein
MPDVIPEFDLYRELEVDPNATTETIEAAWRSLAKRFHPDVARGADAERIARLNLARDWLADPDRRRRYDEDRARKEGDWRRYESHGARPESPGSDGVGRDQTFSERWYGTERAGHTDPAARAAAAAEARKEAAAERRRGAVTIAAFVVVGVVAIGALGSFLLRPGPEPSMPPPVTPNPTINTTGQQELIDALLANVDAPGRTWTVRGDVDLQLDGARGDVRFDAQVDGDDSSGSLSGSLVSGQRDWVVKGARRYLSVDGGKWKLEPRLATNRGWDPFAAIDDEVTPRFLRWDDKGGHRYGLIRLEGLLALDPTLYFDAPYEITDVSNAFVALDVDEAGQPARGQAVATVDVKDAKGKPHRFTVQVEYTFSHVGEPAQIAAPKVG